MMYVEREAPTGGFPIGRRNSRESSSGWSKILGLLSDYFIDLWLGGSDAGGC